MEYQLNVFNITNTTIYDIPQNQTEIGLAYVGDEANYGQVQTTNGNEGDACTSRFRPQPLD